MDKLTIAKVLAQAFVDLLPKHSVSMLGNHPAFMVRSRNVLLSSITVHVNRLSVTLWGREPSVRTLNGDDDGDKFEVALEDPNAITMLIDRACEFLMVQKPNSKLIAEVTDATR